LFIGEKTMDEKSFLQDCREEGLYLFFADAGRLEFTRQNVEHTALAFWEDKSKITGQMRTAAEFQRCDFCPLRKTSALCDAIRPVFPFIDSLDKYVSHNKVTAAYKDDKGVLHISDTTMQDALRYLSVLSLVSYCQVGRKYWKYFLGIMPLMPATEIVTQLYLNFYYLNEGKPKATRKTIEKFEEEITITSRNQAKRLNLICKNDAFINAFVNAQVITQLLALDFEKTLKQMFDSRQPANLPRPIVLPP
jgi:hypothetical protein